MPVLSKGDLVKVNVGRNQVTATVTEISGSKVTLLTERGGVLIRKVDSVIPIDYDCCYEDDEEISAIDAALIDDEGDEDEVDEDEDDEGD